ncbi:unnamed protein product [Rangifer tarandus platyrhynchus]|uniref:GTP-eEF1A C-terminal domain-containing protein n=1 Tax=Rangifer tarandus platyrhynchus TaxID=3082113 RepID=A0ABN8XX39_RANTA|nr:unnamed protein product [Rangifer tarandus platyrhynchus]
MPALWCIDFTDIDFNRDSGAEFWKAITCSGSTKKGCMFMSPEESTTGGRWLEDASTGNVPVGSVETNFLKPGAVVTCLQQWHHRGQVCGDALRGSACSSVKKSCEGYSSWLCGQDDRKEDDWKEDDSKNDRKEIHTSYSPVLTATHLMQVCRIEGENRLVLWQQAGGRPNRALMSGSAAIVQMVPSKAMRVETFSEYPALGHFVVQEMSKMAAIGVVKAMDKKTSIEGKVTKLAVKDSKK